MQNNNSNNSLSPQNSKENISSSPKEKIPFSENKINNKKLYFSKNRISNTSQKKKNLQRTYEIEIIPKYNLFDNIENKDNNTNNAYSQNENEEYNQYKTVSNKFYSLNQNNSLLNEQQSESQVMKDNNQIINSSDNNNNNVIINDSGKMSISELKIDNDSNNNYNDINIYKNENFEKKYLSENNLNIHNKNINIDSENEEEEIYDNNENYNEEIEYDDNSDKNINGEKESIDNADVEDDNEENENEEEKIDNEENENIGENKEKIDLDEFILFNENKDKLSQKENNYIFFGTSNSNENNKEINLDLINNSKTNNNNNNLSKTSEKKRNFFSKILDIEILIGTNEIYTKPWSLLIKEIYDKLEPENDSIQLISLGAQHTLCISNKGKLFSFGWNNYSQCGKRFKKNKSKLDLDKIEEINEIKMGQKITDISTGEDYSLVVTQKGKLYGFGLNTNGQLFYNPKKHKIIKKPALIKNFRRNIITNVKCTNNISFILNEKKEAFICPWEDKQKKINYIPIKIFFPNKAKIIMISCGDNFCMFLSKIGNVYSMGSNNKYGQLGQGNTNMLLSPKIIPFFQKNKIKIIQISCGYSHTLALNSNYEIFSWGLGSEGQLGQNFGTELIHAPHIIEFFEKNKIKIYQVSAGYHSSFFLSEKNEVFISGTNGKEFNKEFLPKKFEVKNKYKDLEDNSFWICRILNCWNRSMSVFYAIFLDCHFINKDDEKVNNSLNLITKKWINQNFSGNIMKGIISDAIKE